MKRKKKVLQLKKQEKKIQKVQKERVYWDVLKGCLLFQKTLTI